MPETSGQPKLEANERFYLGLYFGYHDSSLSVATASNVVLHLEAERVLQRKHVRATADEMHDLIRTALEYLHTSIDNCDGVALVVSGARFALDEVEIEGRRFRPRLVGHHAAHIATVPRSRSTDAVIVCADGGSEDGFGAIYFAQAGTAPVRLERLDDRIANGRTYGAMAQLLVEDDYVSANLDGGGKLLGLAAYGISDSGTQARIRQGTAVLNGGPTSQHEVVRLLGRGLGATVSPHLDPASSGLAATFQHCWTEDLLGAVRSWRHLSPHLAVTGGCAQNVRANATLAHEAGFADMSVPFAPTDAGESIGAVVEAFGVPAPVSAYLGRDFGARLTEATLRNLVDDLRCERVVAMYQGASESGPRALGNRSVLALARDADTRVRVSQHVKHREAYRPIAPAVRYHDMERYFHVARGTQSEYMSYAWPVTDEFARCAPAAVHVDGTSRPQAVSAATNPVLAAILDLLEETGLAPAVLNTSMNVSGRPMVDSPADAVAFFEESGVDVLYLGDERAAR